MAVQAQYPANLLLLNRSETDRNNNNMDCPQTSLINQSPVFFSSNGGNANTKKRGRDLQIPTPIIDSSYDLSAQINRHKDEIEQYFIAQQEQLRRGLIDRRHRQYRTFLEILEKSVNNRIREKETEIEICSNRTIELENRLARIRSESVEWKSKAMEEQSMADCLRAQIQRAAEDEESAYIDPGRNEAAWGACRSCFRRTATVVLVPCRHLCLCPACDFAVSGERCPVCGIVRSGSVQVFFS